MNARLSRRGLLTAIAGGVFAAATLACGGGEAEDCDVEDQAEGDDDCDDGSSLKRKKRRR